HDEFFAAYFASGTMLARAPPSLPHCVTVARLCYCQPYVVRPRRCRFKGAYMIRIERTLRHDLPSSRKNLRFPDRAQASTHIPVLCPETGSVSRWCPSKG